MSIKDNPVAKTTYFYDCIRGSFSGIIFSGLMTIALLIAIRHFEAASWVKSCIASADSIGRFITPLTLSFGLWLGLPTAQLVIRYMLGVAFMLFLAGLAPNVGMYAICIILAYVLFAQPPKLMLHIYSTNYPKKTRGSLVSTMFVYSTFVGIIFSTCFGKLLDVDLSYYQQVLFVMAGCAIICSIALKYIPSKPLCNESSGNPIQNFSIAFKDKLFGWMVLGYFILGIGNAMIIPVRIEYMANYEYGINASNIAITIVNVVIPGLSMTLSTKIWGIIFDRIHFIKTRLLINACFILSYLIFFSTQNITVLAISQAINGFAVAGGMIAWTLWVTKIAPEKKVTAYMSSHVSISGIRGIIAPSIAYALLAKYPPQVVGYTGALLMLISCGMFAILWKDKRIQ